MEITSLQNKKVKYWVSLKEKKVRDKEQLFLVEGDHLLKEAKIKNLVVETISITDKKADYLVTKEIMQKISSQKSISDTIGVCHFPKESVIKGNILIIDALQDPGNLGTIIRSAVAFNFPTIILSKDSVDQYNEKVIRASEGMIFHINILRRDLNEFIPEAKKQGFSIIGTDVTAGISLKEIPHQNIGIVIGNEGKGLSPSIKSLCDIFTKIPMEKTCESLNAGVAAAIIMYEVYHE